MTIEIAIKYVTNREGLRFFTQRWLPARSRALVMFVHGLGDHSGRYAHAVNRFASEGYAVAAYDLRGHGRSDGRRGDIGTFATLLDDLHSFLWETRHEVPQGTPVFLVAINAGALVAANYLVTHPNDIAGLVAVSPSFEPVAHPPRWMRWFGRKLTRIAPWIKVRDVCDAHDLTRDPEAVRAYRDDAFVYHRFTLRTCRQIEEVAELAVPMAFRIRHPVLVMHARDDRISPVDVTRNFYDHISDARKKLVLFDGSFHDPLCDTVRDDALDEMISWIGGLTHQTEDHASAGASRVHYRQ